jgi:hypothetical protein
LNKDQNKRDSKCEKEESGIENNKCKAPGAKISLISFKNNNKRWLKTVDEIRDVATGQTVLKSLDLFLRKPTENCK